MARIRVIVAPRAREDRLRGWQGEVLRVRVRAAPEGGKASDAVCLLVAKTLGLPASRVTVARGRGSREKALEVEGMDEQEVRRRLGAPFRQLPSR